VIVLALILFGGARRARTKRTERQREHAVEQRDEARLRAREAGEADLEARRLAEEAQRRREEADELEQKAAETDPDSRR
jgi:hypothetical protein